MRNYSRLGTSSSSSKLEDLERQLDELERKVGPHTRVWEREFAMTAVRAALVVLARTPSSEHAEALRTRWEALRERLRELDRAQIGPVRASLEAGGYGPADFLRDLETRPRYEWDPFAERLLGIDETPRNERGREADMIKYQATPLEAILEVVQRLGPYDVLYDLGSGLGKVTMLAGWLGPARAIGVEYEPAYHAVAAERARAYGFTRVSFVNADAREVDLSDGTAFYFFYPFQGPIMEVVEAKLRAVAALRPIRIFSLGKCTEHFASSSWLAKDPAPSARIAVFTPRA